MNVNRAIGPRVINFSSVITASLAQDHYNNSLGPTLVTSFDGFNYYLLFVDHYSKYVWLYPMKNKSNVLSIFMQFKALVEKYFNFPIIYYSLTMAVSS